MEINFGRTSPIGRREYDSRLFVDNLVVAYFFGAALYTLRLSDYVTKACVVCNFSCCCLSLL